MSEHEKLGRYELLKRIAKGGMGEIFLARTTGAGGFQKNVIIKTILTHLAEEEEFVEKFLDEGRIVVQLTHGNIVPVFDMGEEDDTYYIAMEYIPGRDLREIIKRCDVYNRETPVENALFLVSEVCKGLDYAHRKTDPDGESLGIVHRDVSPSNILVSSEGEVKIIDFGIARATSRLSKTVSGRIQGKFCYMSPEQASGKPLDGRSDIFSLGIVLYELLTNYRPFEGQTDLESLELIRKADFDPPSTLRPEIPQEVDDIIAKALAKNPNDRYDTIDQLQVVILQYLFSAGAGATSNDLAAFLAELFPDGLERDALKSASKTPKKKMSLDEALDFELGQLEVDAIDPFHTTAMSTTGDELVSVPTIDERPKITIDTHPTNQTNETNQNTNELAIATRTSKRTVAVAFLLGVLAMIAFGVWIAQGDDQATVRVSSDPAGARITVDGKIYANAITPTTLLLSPGRHEIELRTEGFEPQKIAVDLIAGEEISLNGTNTKLLKTKVAKPRTITVRAVPTDAVLTADDTNFGTGEGAKIMLKPDQTVRITAKHPSCETLNFLVPYAFEKNELTLTLKCDVAAPDVETPIDTNPKNTKIPPKTVTYTSIPTGADVRVNGKLIGKTPKTVRYNKDETLKVSFSYEGYRSLQISKKVSATRGNIRGRLVASESGCLSIRLDNPGVGEIQVDGKTVSKGKSSLSKYRVNAGAHTVRVINKKAGKDDTFTVNVKPGDRCAYKLIWPRSAPK